MKCLVSEDVTTVELNEKINRNAIFLVPGMGTSELNNKIFEDFSFKKFIIVINHNINNRKIR